ncbi:TonB-dependent receptor domain-containing protein [Candidatus Zixiibacteriota bacterium]
MGKNILMIWCSAFFLVGIFVLPLDGFAQSDHGGIIGTIFDAETGDPLPSATIVLLNRFASTAADRAGEFTFGRLSPGRYLLQVSHVGYATRVIDNVAVAADQITELAVRLTPQPISLKTITVTPGRFSIMGSEPAARQSLTQLELKTMPQLGDDFFRAVNRLPGVSGNDFSTRFTIRGAEYEEVLVTLDGLQIYEPFHMKDIDGGAMSIIDVASVRNIDLITGGFPANYGDKMSGVLNIKSRSVPPDRRRLAASISLIGARLLAEGVFDQNRGSWLVSARRGYIDYVLHMVDPESQIDPKYYDVFGKLQYQLGKNHILSLDLLHAGDDLRYEGEDGDDGDTLITAYGNSYLWLNWWAALHAKLLVQTVASVGHVDHNRRGQMFNSALEQPEHIAHDDEDFRFVGLKTDWEYETTDYLIMKFGADVRQVRADYDYLSREFYYDYRVEPEGAFVDLARVDSLAVQLGKSGNKSGAYLTNRLRLAEPLVVEFGLRYDHASYSHDDLLSPRINLVYNLDEKTTIRSGWGYYYQTEGIDEISIGDGETDFYPAQQAEHRVIGFEHRCAPDINLRLEVYDKRYADLRPVFRNSFDEIEPFPERESDRVIVHRKKADSRGLEVYLKKDSRDRFSWWFSYAYAKVEDHVRYIYYPPEDVTAYHHTVIPNPNDQRHTLYADIHYRPTPRWQCTMAFQYHSGWPYTNIYLASQRTAEGVVYWAQAGEPWGTRHHPYHRLDLRVNRYFPLARGRITAFFEILNVLGRENVRGYDYSFYGGPGGPLLTREPEHWIGLLPSFGVSYEIGF